MLVKIIVAVCGGRWAGASKERGRKDRGRKERGRDCCRVGDCKGASETIPGQDDDAQRIHQQGVRATRPLDF